MLQVFVEAGCGACRRAMALADEVRARFPGARVEVVNLSGPGAQPPESVFAVPTFVLDGRVLSLGNPRRATLMGALAARLGPPAGSDMRGQP